MNLIRSRDPVLTEYVRERLDQWEGERRARPAKTDSEAGLQTILRPRPTMGVEPRHSGADADLPESTAQQGSERRSVRFTRQHLIVVAIVLAVGALIAGYALTRARAVPVAAPVVVESQGLPGPAATSSEPTPSTLPVRVHVVGEVGRPGVHTLPQGSRVVEAIEAAGGLTPEADLGALNLAQVVADGQQIVIGDSKQPSEVRGADGSAGGSAGTGAAGSSGAIGPGAKVNLNTATPAQLDSLPGVGPVTAEKIIAWRTQHGRFSRIEELQEVPGIGPKSFAEIAPHVTV